MERRRNDSATEFGVNLPLQAHKCIGDLSLAIRAWFRLDAVGDGAFTNFPLAAERLPAVIWRASLMTADGGDSICLNTLRNSASI